MLEVIASRFREAGLTAADAELFAKATLRDLDAQGVVKRVDRELPSIFDFNEDIISALEYRKKLAGYVATESLLKEE